MVLLYSTAMVHGGVVSVKRTTQTGGQMDLYLPASDSALLRKAAKRRGVAPERLLKRLILGDLSHEDELALSRELGGHLFVRIVESFARQLEAATAPKGAPS